MPDFEQIGLESVFKNDQFVKGVSDYLANLQKAISASQKAGTEMTSMGTSADKSAGRGLDVLAIAAGNVAATLITKLITSVGEATASVISLGKESIMTAGRVQELELIAQLLGQRAGASANEIAQQTEDIKDLGIRTDVALQLQAQFARYQLDIAKATDLARVAQDAAVLSMADSSDTLDHLLYGILTYNTRVIRTSGLNVDVSLGFEKMADSLGITTDELTEAQKITATLNAVLSEGTRIAGVYETAMSAPAKQLRSLSRHVFEAKNALGKPFLGAWAAVLKVVTDVVKAFGALFKEGGRLYPLMVNLGAVAEIVAEGFAGLVKPITDSLLDSVDVAEMIAERGGDGIALRMADAIKTQESARLKMARGWIDTAARAFSWGANIVIQLAKGIVKAASSVLVAAIKFVGKIITSWFKPGSPPKVAPDLDKWGFGAVQAWLEGFTDADFSALESIQGPLKSALDFFAEIGTIGGDDVGRIYADLSKGLIQAFESGGANEDLINTITSSLGVFGGEIAQLVELQFQLAGATDAVTESEKKLKEAQDAQRRAGEQVTQATAEYNDLLRAGASEDVLAAKLAEINAAEEAEKQSYKQSEAAELELELAQERAEAIQAQIALQSKLIDQLIELARIQAKEPPEEEKDEKLEDELADEGAGGGGGAGEDLADALDDALAGAGEIGGMDMEKLFDPLRLAMDQVKADIKEKLGGVWTELKNQWLAEVSPLWEPVTKAWNELKPKLNTAWQGVKTWFSNETSWFTGQVETWWAEHGESVQGILDWLWLGITTGWQELFGQTSFDVDAGLANVKRVFDEKYAQFKEAFQLGMETLGVIVDTVWLLIQGKTDEAWETIRGFVDEKMEGITTAIDTSAENARKAIETKWNEIKTNTATRWNEIKTDISTKVEEIKKNVETKFNEAKNAAETKINELKTGVTTKFTEIKTAVETKMSDIRNAVNTKITEAKQNIIDRITEAKNWLQNLNLWSIGWNLVQGLIDGIKAQASAVVSALKGVVEAAIAAVKEKLGIESPSKVGFYLGEMFGLGIKGGVTSTGQSLTDALSGMINSSIRGAMVPNQTSYSRTLNFDMGGVNINNGMDYAVLTSTIRRIIRQEFGA